LPHARLLPACGGSDNNNSSPHLVGNIAVSNSASPAFGFDLSYADQGKYFLWNVQPVVLVLKASPKSSIFCIGGAASSTVAGERAASAAQATDGGAARENRERIDIQATIERAGRALHAG
jgi:hypothetical protein